MKRKNEFKKLLSVLLALMMIISAVPLSGIGVFAATSGDFEYGILEDGTVQITGYNGSEYETVEIPAEIAGKAVTSIASSAFARSNIILISVPETVTSIGEKAFLDCEISSVYIPETVTSIGDMAFGYYTDYFDDSFHNRYGFKVFGAAGSTAEAYASENGFSFVAVSSDNKYPAEYSYRDNEDGSVSIDYIETPVKEIWIPAEIDGKPVTGVSTFFDSYITDIFVDENNQIYTDIDGVLYSKDKTTLLSYPSGKEDKTYSIPEGTICLGESSFQYNYNLAEIIFPSTLSDIASYSIDNFSMELDTISVDENNKTFRSKDGVLFNDSCTELLLYPSGRSEKTYSVPDGVIRIGDRAFVQCKCDEILLPNGLKEIGNASFCYSKIKKLKLPGSVEIIEERAFSFTQELETFEFADNNNIKTISDFAFGYSSLKSIDIPGTVIQISEGAFETTDLRNVTLGYGIKTIGNEAFAGYGLKQITIPESVTEIGEHALGYIYNGGIALDDEFEEYTKIDDFKIYGYSGTAAETYADDNGFEFIALDKTADESTGISVFEKDLNVIPDGAQLKAQQLSADDNKITFDISLIKDGVQVQPRDEVTVKIPVPEGMDGSLLKVYREEANGTYTDMNAYFADGYMVFTTDHFSKYILTVEESSAALKGDINGDGIVDAADAVLALRFDAGLISLTDEQVKTADVNSDGIADAADAVLILRYDAGLIDEL